MKTKKTLLPLLFLLLSLVSSLRAQSIHFGLKGALLYDFGGALREQNLKNTYKSIAKLSWQAGAFCKIPITQFFLQPELLYTHLRTSFSIPNQPPLNSQNTRLDLLVPIGFSPIASLRAYLGPVLCFDLKHKVDSPEATPLSKNTFSAGFSIGLGIDLFLFCLDLKYEKILLASQNTFSLHNKSFHLSSKSSLLALALSMKF